MAPSGDLEDPGFNIELGTRFLAGLMREFNDPRLALAAYNAGPNRVRQWLATRRSDDIEAFVEQIPFDETRNYVMRIIENTQVYRARLNNGVANLRIAQDLGIAQKH